MDTLSEKSVFLESNLQFSVLQLVSWPPLPQLLQETTPHATRVCALLARRPSAGMLIPVMLGISTQVAYPVLETLYNNGHIVPMAVLTPEQTRQATAEPLQNPEPAAAAASFLGKIWHRLMDGK